MSGSDVLTQVTTEPFDVTLPQDYAAPCKSPIRNPGALFSAQADIPTLTSTIGSPASSLADITDITRWFARQGAQIGLPPGELSAD